LTERLSSFPLLKTKLYIPIPPASRVVRSALIDQLGDVEKKALTMISAPAGFGKTTLLAEWIAHTSLPIAWLSLDNGDNDPYRFLAYLIYALESIHDDFGEEAQQLLHAAQPVLVDIILTSLINDLGAADGPYALVLDDYQFITAHPVHELLTYLLDHMPVNMHLVIATRADPPLGLARLRSKGKFLEIRTSDLRFHPEETVEFLNHTMELQLAPDDLLLLDQKIEGWIAGLQMAALSLKGREDASRFIKTFSGSNRYIMDYLTDEVLSKQARDIRTFLVQTSILDRMCSSLCRSVVEWEVKSAQFDGTKTAGEATDPVRDCQTILEYLERTNLFIVPLDDEKCWYQYHHLFADLLRAQLLRSLSAQAVVQLHLRAADWHADNSSYLEAIHHASMASDNERVEHFVQQNYLELMSRGEQSWLRSWTSNLSKDLVYSRPWLCIYEAYSHSWFGELDEADLLLEEAEKRISAEISAPEADSIRGLLAYVKSRVTAMRGDIQRAIELCLEARKYIPADNQAMQLDTLITLGYEYFLNGDYANASQVLNETIRSGIRAGAVINTVAASCVMARLYTVQGRLHKSYDTYQRAAQAIPEESGQHLGARALVEIGIADVLCEQNDLEAAQVHMQQGLALLPFWGKVDDSVLAYITLARIHLARANKRDAQTAVEKALQVIHTSGIFSEARHAVEVAQVKVWLAQGDLQAVNSWAASQEERLGSQDGFGFENELTRITLARVYIAQNKLDKALALLSRLEGVSRPDGRLGRVVEILILQALALYATENHFEALDILRKALMLSQPEGYVRIYLNEGETMLRLLTRGQEQGLWNTSPLEEYVNTLLGAFKGEKIHS
jgi:LuxR family transcriptional regulator, maltose regulon positive regulatory protein